MLWWTLRKLKAGTADERRKAALELVESNNPRAVASFVEVLAKDATENALWPTALALADIVSKVSKDHVRHAAAEGLAALGPRGIAALLALRRNPQSIQWDSIEDCLTAMGRRDLRPLLAALPDENAHVFWRCRIARALGRTGDKRAVPSLVAALTDRSVPLRGEAAWALGQLGDTSVAERLAAGPEISEDERKAFGWAGKERVEEEFVFALASLGDPRAVKPLASYFRSAEQNESRRLKAAEFLLKFGKVAAPRVIEILESPEAGSVHYSELLSRTVRLLSQIDDPRSVGPLLHRAKCGGPKAKEVVESLRKVVRSVGPQVDTAILQELGTFSQALQSKIVWVDREGDQPNVEEFTEIDCSDIAALARKELARRGV
jgi:HEAT repeat protein